MFVLKSTHEHVVAAYREGIEQLRQHVDQLQLLADVQAAEIEMLRAKVPARGQGGRFQSRAGRADK